VRKGRFKGGEEETSSSPCDEMSPTFNAFPVWLLSYLLHVSKLYRLSSYISSPALC